MSTWLTERLGLRVPLVGAPMAGVSGGALAGAISAAGALGMIGVGNATPAEVITEQSRIAGHPFGIGLMAWVLRSVPGQFEATLAARPALVSVSFGDYAPYVGPLRDAGIVVATQIGTLAEARAAERAGVDLIVARGAEGGGHGLAEVGTLPLLQSVVAAVSVPVLAAGGLSSARGVAAVLAAGAAGAWVGTAFLLSTEAATPPAARERLQTAADTDTAYGRVFDIGARLDWPTRYGGRALRNGFFDRWVGREAELAADDAAYQDLTGARARGDFDTAPIYAGQGVGLLTRPRPAAEVVDELTRNCA